MSIVHPRSHPPQTDAVRCRYQTRMRKRNSFSVSAPTGQMSTTLPAYLLFTGWCALGLKHRTPGSPGTSVRCGRTRPFGIDLSLTVVVIYSRVGASVGMNLAERAVGIGARESHHAAKRGPVRGLVDVAVLEHHDGLSLAGITGFE